MKYRPRDDAPVFEVEAPPDDLPADGGALERWIEAGDLPAYRVPPPTHDNDPPAGPLWALRDDVDRLAEGKELDPPAEPDDHLRRVYVIELVGCEINTHREGDCVYVGESVRSPRNRFIQHLLGYKAGRGHAEKWGTRLLPCHYRDVPASRTGEDSRERERQKARQLADEGNNIHGAQLGT